MKAIALGRSNFEATLSALRTVAPDLAARLESQSRAIPALEQAMLPPGTRERDIVVDLEPADCSVIADTLQRAGSPDGWSARFEGISVSYLVENWRALASGIADAF